MNKKNILIILFLVLIVTGCFATRTEYSIVHEPEKIISNIHLYSKSEIQEYENQLTTYLDNQEEVNDYLERVKERLSLEVRIYDYSPQKKSQIRTLFVKIDNLDPIAHDARIEDLTIELNNLLRD